MANILIIDDEAGIRTAVGDILEDEGYKSFAAGDGIAGLNLLRQEEMDLVILDVWLPRMGGIDVLKAIREEWPMLEVIIISGHASIEMAVNAVKLGAFDFIEKPLSIDRISTAVRNALAMARLRAENKSLKQSHHQTEDIIAKSAAMQEIVALIEQSARSDSRVLITGDNGTGKELAALRIHELSARRDGPFVAVNCAALPDTLIESELFGHEKGAFTDALARRKGKFETANYGTLFLDEIADMSLNAQAKVLRAIQEMKFERLGGEESIAVDIRIIAATNKDLKEEIAQGRFREDLYFRLNVLPIHMPSLSERLEDIGALARFFLASLPRCANRKLSQEAIELISSHTWPGNIRELRNFIERLAVMSDEEEISSATVRHFLDRNIEYPVAEQSDELFLSLTGKKLSEAKNEFERLYLVHHLRKTGYNVSRAAEAIGLYPGNLHAKIKKLGIEAGE